MKVVDLSDLAGYKRIFQPKHEVPPGQSVLNTFGKALNNALSKTNELQLEAEDLMEKLATGEVSSIHQVMVGLTKAELALQFVLEVRNKLTELYKEISRMPV